eukprot:PhF_6_TR4460/c0_g1_i3/m.6058
MIGSQQQHYHQMSTDPTHNLNNSSTVSNRQQRNLSPSMEPIDIVPLTPPSQQRQKMVEVIVNHPIDEDSAIQQRKEGGGSDERRGTKVVVFERSKSLSGEDTGNDFESPDDSSGKVKPTKPKETSQGQSKILMCGEEKVNVSRDIGVRVRCTFIGTTSIIALLLAIAALSEPKGEPAMDNSMKNVEALYGVITGLTGITAFAIIEFYVFEWRMMRADCRALKIKEKSYWLHNVVPLTI